jgi:hypothetical protein
VDGNVAWFLLGIVFGGAIGWTLGYLFITPPGWVSEWLHDEHDDGGLTQVGESEDGHSDH